MNVNIATGFFKAGIFSLSTLTDSAGTGDVELRVQSKQFEQSDRPESCLRENIPDTTVFTRNDYASSMLCA